MASRRATSCASIPTPRRRCSSYLPEALEAPGIHRSTSIPIPPTRSSPRRPPPTSAPVPTRSSSVAAPTRCSTSSPRPSWPRAARRSCRCRPTRCTRCSPGSAAPRSRPCRDAGPRTATPSTWRPCSRRSRMPQWCGCARPTTPPARPSRGPMSRPCSKPARPSPGGGPVVVVDEAYIEFHPDSLVSLRERYPALIVVRTMSKAFALTGLRVGYAVAAAADHRAARAAAPTRQRQHGVGQGRRGRPARSRRWPRPTPIALGAEREWLAARLTELGLAPLPERHQLPALPHRHARPRRMPPPRPCCAAASWCARSGRRARWRAPALHGPRPRSRTNDSSRSSEPGRMGGQHERDHDAASASARRRRRASR